MWGFKYSISPMPNMAIASHFFVEHLKCSYCDWGVQLFFLLTVINLKLKSQMWIVGTKLDNVCYRSMENGKTDVDYELRKSSWRMMTLGFEIRSRKKGWHILSEGLNGSSQMLKDDIFGISLETWSKKNLRTSDNNNINGSYLLILQVTY